MTDRTIEHEFDIGSDYFRLNYSRNSVKNLSFYLSQFNFYDYYCFKSTRHQRLVSYEEFVEFKYCAYSLYKKDLYNINHINLWIDWIIKMKGIQFIKKPFPPFHPNKIIVK